MTRARLLAEADSRELSQWMAFLQVEAEDEQKAASGNTPAWPGLAGGA